MSKVDITIERALELAQEFLGNQWDSLKTDQVKLSKCGGGYCARLYLCEDISGRPVGKDDVTKFLIRLYGGRAVNEDSPLIKLDTASQVLFLYECGRLGLGPKLYGSFKGGRLEEFIPCHTLNDSDLEDPDIRKQIARRLARYHNIKLPLTRHPLDHYKAFEEWYTLFDTEEGHQTATEYCQWASLPTDWFENYDWRSELDWMKRTEPKIKTRYVMNNNDMKRDNCLIRDTPDQFGERVVLIDYEINSMNPRGMDIGHHFAMWTADYTRKGQHFAIDYPYPSEAIRREFIEEYLNETRKLVDYEFDKTLDTVDHVMMEADFFGLKVIHFWISMSLFPKHLSDALGNKSDAIGFISLGHTFLRQYYERKELFINQYGFK